MKKCAFLTLDEPGDFMIDDEHAIGPLANIGWDVTTVSWRQTAVPWSNFEAVIIRSTWDYWNDVSGFLDVLEKIDQETRLANSLDLVRWNLSKTYLRDLQAREINIVPTLWPETVEPDGFPALFSRFESDELVIKPVVGANGEDAYRVSAGDPADRIEDICARFQGRAAMVQQFMPAILEEGEFSLFYFNGGFSHAIRKVPAASEFRSQEERGAEIYPATPDELLLLRGQLALEALSEPPLYARIDFVRNTSGDFAVMEQELIEPSLYLRMDPRAPQRFAIAVDGWFSSA
jgi:glutathione synthase/RimK-type ligase-like ATP-grasp enzyme